MKRYLLYLGIGTGLSIVIVMIMFVAVKWVITLPRLGPVPFPSAIERLDRWDFYLSAFLCITVVIWIFFLLLMKRKP